VLGEPYIKDLDPELLYASTDEEAGVAYELEDDA